MHRLLVLEAHQFTKPINQIALLEKRAEKKRKQREGQREEQKKNEAIFAK